MNKLITSIILVAIIATVSAIFFFPREDSAGRFTVDTSNMTASTTAWTVGPGNSTQVLGSYSRRGGFILSNNSARDIYVVLGTSASANQGILMTASSTREFDRNNWYTGEVSVRGTVASTTLLVTEYRF